MTSWHPLYSEPYAVYARELISHTQNLPWFSTELSMHRTQGGVVQENRVAGRKNVGEVNSHIYVLMPMPPSAGATAATTSAAGEPGDF